MSSGRDGRDARSALRSSYLPSGVASLFKAIRSTPIVPVMVEPPATVNVPPAPVLRDGPIAPAYNAFLPGIVQGVEAGW